ncbi:hybrid sensor histidine kinase/response regulator [Rubrimonas cliftonensis]|uniref:histidine kinase n=1 Tax=Rubrimonas cliftonensis TaxID=89524 RepID=A0A1H3WVP0_9RHOB|nr:hybrid sensor histidine kinase/response regulator [Rubrimonas cliftonensis]SDZ91226.1 Signal transduction histidine kinase [Rubrimonas cliftonensis]
MNDAPLESGDAAARREGRAERTLRVLALAVAAFAAVALCLAVMGGRNALEASRARLAAQEYRAAFEALTEGATAAAENIARLRGASDHLAPEELEAFVRSAVVASSPMVLQQGWAPVEAAAPGAALLLIDRDEASVRVLSGGAAQPALAGRLARIEAGAVSIDGFATRDPGREATPGVVTILAPTARGAGRIDGAAFATIDLAAVAGALPPHPRAEIVGLRVVRDGVARSIFGDGVARPALGDGVARPALGDGAAKADDFLQSTRLRLADAVVEIDVGWRPMPAWRAVLAQGDGALTAALLGILLTCALATLAPRRSALSAAAAAAASRRKSQLVAALGHEVRTPLTAIIGMAEQIRKGPMTERQSVEAATLVRLAESLLSTIGQILDFSTLEGGRLDVDSVDTDLAGLVGEVAQAMNVLAAQKRLDLVVNMPLHVPRLVKTDPPRLRRILTNLLSNAVKFTSEGAVTLTVSLNRERGDRGGPAWFRFVVADTGAGMTPEQARIVFEPFGEASGAAARGDGGAGLGPGVARRLARLLGGDVAVSSRPGRGAVFTLELPFETLPAPRRLRREIGLCSAQKILVAVQDARTRDVLVETLDGVGALAVGVCDIAEARDALAGEEAMRDPFDMVLFQGVFRDRGSLLETLDLAQSCGLRPTPVWVRPSWMVPAEAPQSSCGVATVLEGPFLPENVARGIAHAASGGRIAASPEPGNAAQGPGRRGPSVLLVEDDPANREHVEALLKGLGCKTRIAGDGVEAIEAMRQARFDLVLTACQTPAADGCDAAGRMVELMRAGALCEAPIIALTEETTTEDRARSLAAGMSDCLARPVRAAALAALVDRWTARGPAGAAAQADARDAGGAPPAAARPSTPPAAAPSSPPSSPPCAAPAGGPPDLSGPEAAQPWPTGPLDAPLERFAAELRRDLLAMPAALEAGDLDACSRAARAMRVSAGRMGATALAEAAQDLELSAQAADATPAHVALTVRALAVEFRAFVAGLKGAA